MICEMNKTTTLNTESYKLKLFGSLWFEFKFGIETWKWLTVRFVDRTHYDAQNLWICNWCVACIVSSGISQITTTFARKTAKAFSAAIFHAFHTCRRRTRISHFMSCLDTFMAFIFICFFKCKQHILTLKVCSFASK